MHCAGVQASGEARILFQPDARWRVRPWQGLPHQLHVPCRCLPEEGGYKSFHVNYFVLKRTSLGTGVQSQRVSMEEGEVKLNLNVLDLPGFGDEIDNSRWFGITISNQGGSET